MATAWEFRAYDKDQFTHFVRGFYNVDSSVRPLTDDRSTRAYFKGSSSEHYTQAIMSVSTPLRFLSDTDAFAVCLCGSGGLRFLGDRGAYEIAPNAGMCLSPGKAIDATTAPGTSSTVTHLDTDRVHQICAAWLGSALDAPLALEEGAFSPLLHAQWTLLARSLDLMHAGAPASDWARDALVEYAVGLLLHGHPHNYAKYLDREQTASARTIARAHAFIEENAERPVTPAEIAGVVGCSLSALSRGFSEHLGISLRECIYGARVARAHGMLTNGTAACYHDVLRGVGFTNVSRFETAYRRTYGQAPAETWRRHGPGPGAEPHAGGLSPEKAERLRAHIVSALSGPVRVCDLAALAGMSETRFRIAFKAAFGMSPAQFVLEERLNWAQWLLMNTAKGVAAIAAETGFSSQAHLTTALRQGHGVTPGALRNRRAISRAHARPPAISPTPVES